MKKTLLPFLFLFTLATVQLSAQISIENDTLFSEVFDGVNDVVGHNTLTNNVPQQKTYRWVRTEVTMPDNWESAICDPNQCYLTSVDSMEFNLGPAGSGLLDVHVYPDVDWNGYAMVEVAITDINDASNTVSGVYIFDSELTSISEVHELEFKVYPNPTNGLFSLDGNLENIEFISVFSTSGHRMVHQPIQGGDWYDITNLPMGTYLIQLSNKEGVPLGTKLVGKY